jgi:hypothetical protein
MRVATMSAGELPLLDLAEHQLRRVESTGRERRQLKAGAVLDG